jgi:DNA (cytosine-5)-methyltransferase 1
MERMSSESPITTVDLFCGVGGLTHGLRKAGVGVAAGIDIDAAAEYPYSANNPGSTFKCWDLSRKNYQSIEKLFAPGKIRLLAGCAPCQPFSKLTNAKPRHDAWNLLDNFARFVSRIQPELVTMENVPELVNRGRDVFEKFVSTLERAKYVVTWKVVQCSEYGAPQSRKRVVLLASKIGPIAIPKGRRIDPAKWKTVRETIAGLPPVAAGGEDPNDPLHVAAKLSPTNLERIRATRRDGGSRESWPDELVLECHRRKSGARYPSIYGRMWWDKPAPTMTTLCTGIGNGRFGHPEQDRAITLREAALLQTFPPAYDFWPRGITVNRSAVARLIGNAVPPILGEVLGKALLEHVRYESTRLGRV